MGKWREVKAMLSKVVRESQRDWNSHLKKVLFCMQDFNSQDHGIYSLPPEFWSVLKSTSSSRRLCILTNICAGGTWSTACSFPGDIGTSTTRTSQSVLWSNRASAAASKDRSQFKLRTQPKLHRKQYSQLKK